MRIKASVACLWLTVYAFAGVSVSNLVVEQREGTKLIDIQYDAFNDAGSAVGIAVVISNGTSRVNTSSFSGDIGEGVSTGTERLIIWDV